MPKVSKQKRGQLLKEFQQQMQAQGKTQQQAIEKLNQYMQDPIKLRIMNALAASI